MFIRKLDIALQRQYKVASYSPLKRSLYLFVLYLYNIDDKKRIQKIFGK